MLTIIGLFAGPFGRILTYLIGALVAIGVFTGVYMHWKNNIRLEALSKFNQAQTEQSAKDRKVFEEKQQAILNQLDVMLGTLKDQNEALDKKIENINDFLASPEALKQDRPSSDIIKETIRRLGR